jgi:hypothetical protein
MSSSVSPSHLAPPSDVVPLLNSVIDVCLVYGVDETSSREIPVTEEGDINSVYKSLLEREIKLHFLQILTPGAVYPDRVSRPNIWPPGGTSSPDQGGSVEGDVESSIHTTHSKRFKMNKGGLPWETVETVHWFMYPEGPQLSSEDIEPSIIPMLFTNIEGTRSYASGLRFYRPFFIQKLDGSNFYNIISWESGKQPPPNSKLVYLPTCVVLVSKSPHFQFQKDALSGFHRRWCEQEESSMRFWQCVQRFTERLFLVPAPPPGLLSVECLLPGFTSSLVIRPPRRAIYPDIRLHCPFICLSLDNVLKVMAALLTEQRIIFVSSLYPMLTYVIQCFLHYIYPFEWRLPCVPILPFLQIDYLDAVGSNIMGCHANMSRTPEFQSMEDVVIVDLDSDLVTCKLKEPLSLPCLPSYPTKTFCSRYEQLVKANFEIEQLRKLSHMSSDDLLREKTEFEQHYDSCLSAMFLELMVNIYYEVTERLVESRVKFDETVRDMPLEDQAFYKHANHTEMFSAFYQSRRQRVRDDFTLLAERIKRSHRKSIDVADDLNSVFVAYSTAQTPGHTPLKPVLSTGVVYSMAPLFSIVSPRRTAQTAVKHSVSHPPPTTAGTPGTPLTSLEESMRVSPPIPPSSLSLFSPGLSPSSEMVTVQLPSLPGDSFTRESFIAGASSALSDLTDNKSIQAQCMYLQAFYQICQGNIIQAMDDLYDNLPKLEIKLRPSLSLTQRILSLLSDDQLAEVMKRSYYQYIVPVKKKAAAMKRHATNAMGSRASYNLDRKLPTKPLSNIEFNKLVRENAIVTDAESADNLFRILSQNRASITPQTFVPFYDSWKLVQQECLSMDLMGFELERGDREKTGERVIAVGETARTPYGGQNQLVLTTYRFLAVTNFRTHVLADLRRNLRIEKSDLPLGILPGSKMPGITIVYDNREEPREEKTVTERVTARLVRNKHHSLANTDSYAGFEDVVDRDDWYRMLLEVQRGWMVAQARKDPGVMETAMCHVVLLDAIVGSGLLDRLNHTQRGKCMMKLMTLQTKDVSEVTQFTVEALQYRINPCLHETQRQTVESLLYIPPPDPLEAGLGKLWLGLGNGCLKVYDMDEKCFESNIKISDAKGKSLRLSCLLLVNHTVWVASFFSKNIHILDAETVCHVSQVSYLEEAPRDLCLSDQLCHCSTAGPQVWCLLVNGTLLAFDPDTRTRTCKMQVPISDDSAFFTVTCFTIWKSSLWVGTNRGTIAVMDANDGRCVHEIFFPGGPRKQVEIKHLALSSENEIWCSVNSTPRSKDSTFLTVFDAATHEKKLHYTDLESRVAVILPVHTSMWCGTKGGKILIFNSKNYSTGETSQLSAHEDIIRTMTVADRYVVSGSGSNDGYAAVWRAVSS